MDKLFPPLHQCALGWRQVGMSVDDSPPSSKTQLKPRTLVELEGVSLLISWGMQLTREVTCLGLYS